MSDQWTAVLLTLGLLLSLALWVPVLDAVARRLAARRSRRSISGMAASYLSARVRR